MSIANYKKCEVCGKMFLAMGKHKICPQCRSGEDEQFLIVKDYLYDYPKATTEEVAQQTDISEIFILKWIEEGRLEQIDNVKTYPCEMCGKTIHTGKICKKCHESLAEMKNDLSQAEKKQSPRTMYIAGKKK